MRFLDATGLLHLSRRPLFTSMSFRKLPVCSVIPYHILTIHTWDSESLPFFNHIQRPPNWICSNLNLNIVSLRVCFIKREQKKWEKKNGKSVEPNADVVYTRTQLMPLPRHTGLNSCHKYVSVCVVWLRVKWKGNTSSVTRYISD